MFTGIVAAVGRITEVRPLGEVPEAGVRARIEAGGLPLDRTRLGDSIAVQGACMTVVALHEGAFEVDISRESLDRTCGLDRPGEVNLEHAMRLGDSLDGHLVSGHVDGVGQVTCMEAVGESFDLRVIVPAHLSKYLAYKGSLAVNGVSLTVNRVVDQEEGTEAYINLIPHTVEVTTLRHLDVGSPVNIEVDMLARYVERMVGAGGVPG
ncbi:riboflavin synthase [Castellaniella sp. S9]|uniref:riboflavin synthase n=1 Tax=Castellaniella sp. S9 TaxID=2993652 RepID=UPI0022B41F28|nr:riboflavin synthase [Castellaniella sp. S9]